MFFSPQKSIQKLSPNNFPMQSQSDADNAPEENPLTRVKWWFFFVLATYLMSLWFQAFRVFTVTPTWINGLLWIAVMIAMVPVLGILLYDSYVKEKARGRVEKPLRIFEYFLEKSKQKNSKRNSVHVE